MDDLKSKIKELREAIRDYRLLTVNGDPEILSIIESGSRVMIPRDKIDRLLQELAGRVDLSEFVPLILESDKFLREHAAQYWEWCLKDGRHLTREWLNPPTTHWWWYLDRPDLWPPLEEGLTSARPASPKE